MAATLSTLRARIRTQIEAASGKPEPLVVTTSAIDLATSTPNLRGRVEASLQDSGHSRWSTDDLDEAIRKALDQYSILSPHTAIGTIALATAGREISLTTLTGLVRVEKVWWDYDSGTPGYPPNYRQFEVWPGSILYIDDETEPTSGEIVRVWYTLLHTLKDLDSAATTTISTEDVTAIVHGAAGFAAQQRSIERTENLNVDKDTTTKLNTWSERQLRTFRFLSRRTLPAWQRHAYGYDQDDLNEAIRWALHRYNEIQPDEAITSLTLAASGREVDISSITDYTHFTRVWWPYTASDQNPLWQNFELWPGDILFLDTSSEPQSGEIVRAWYERLHTLNGLDSATTTTFKDDVENLIVVGASGFATQERRQEEPGRGQATKLREWSEARLREFERGLKALAKRQAARSSGIAPSTPLDRWDTKGDDW